MLIMIWAQDEKALIGKNDTLPWHLPNDLRFFKEKTLHHTIVMGRTTFEGMQKRVLPNRHTIILTRDKNYRADNVEVCHDIEEIVARAKTEDIYIVGGASVYAQFAEFADVLFQTVIHENFEGDTHFPSINFSQFVLAEETQGVVDEKNQYAHTFKKFERKQEKG